MEKNYLDPKDNPFLPKGSDPMNPGVADIEDTGEMPDPDSIQNPRVPLGIWPEEAKSAELEEAALIALEKNPEICIGFGEYLMLKDGRPIISDGLRKVIDLKTADDETLAKVKEAITSE
jgi:hypothetical protein